MSGDCSWLLWIAYLDEKQPHAEVPKLWPLEEGADRTARTHGDAECERKQRKHEGDRRDYRGEELNVITEGLVERALSGY